MHKQQTTQVLPAKDGTSWQAATQRWDILAARTYKSLLSLPKDVTSWQVATQR